MSKNPLPEKVQQSVKERTAKEDTKHWTMVVRRDLNRFIELSQRVMQMRPSQQGWSKKQQEVHSEHSQSIDTLLSHTDQWYKSLTQPKLPEEIKQSMQIDILLKEIVHHLRNIKEHWENNRQYFEDFSKAIPKNKNTRSVKWYRENFPDKTPWTCNWLNVNGFMIGGILDPQKLAREIEKIERLVN